jgi:hypothetical protein
VNEEVKQGTCLGDMVLLCGSKHPLTSWWVNNEIGTALEKEHQFMKERG